MNPDDTIAAIATGVGGALAVARISGPRAIEVGNRVWTGANQLERRRPRRMLLGRVGAGDAGGEPGDPALAVCMPGPNSYTGDDVVEIHCHGGVINTRKILELILNAGARGAEPGEFTYRAFINGKMDLTQAEAVSELIAAHGDKALRLAERQLRGRLGATVRELRGPLLDALAECESRLDFPEEDLNWTPTAEVAQTLAVAAAAAGELRRSERDGIVLRDGIRVVIAGKPNVGKSSLLNLLLGVDRAIVAALPGTTRDTIEEFAQLRGIPVTLIDTAGIREVDDIIEREGVERAMETMRGATMVIWLLDASADPSREMALLDDHVRGMDAVVAVWNKVDLADGRSLPDAEGIPTCRISVRERIGVEAFLDAFEERGWGRHHVDEPEVAVSGRHGEALDAAITALAAAEDELTGERWELVASHVRTAVEALGRILGENVEPDILDSIFSKFCVGK